MHGNEQHVRVVPIDILGAVAVVAVGINDCNPFAAVVLTDEFDHDCFVIDVAETPVAVDNLHRVMSGWPDHGKGFVDLLLHYQSGRLDGAAGGDQMRFSTDLFGTREAVVN